MGRFRCLSKPLKRFMFSHADKVSERWVEKSSKKYTLKYINKINKLNNYDTVEDFDPKKYNTIIGLNDFRCDLLVILNKEKGLAHGKVREYWLRRGPRLLITLIAIIIITFLLANYLTEASYDDNIYSLIISISMVIYSMYMLYQKLIDSIAGAMLRKGHDHYKEWKKVKVYNKLKVTEI
jgi:hypothetical protein